MHRTCIAVGCTDNTCIESDRCLMHQSHRSAKDEIVFGPINIRADVGDVLKVGTPTGDASEPSGVQRFYLVNEKDPQPYCYGWTLVSDVPAPGTILQVTAVGDSKQMLGGMTGTHAKILSRPGEISAYPAKRFKYSSTVPATEHSIISTGSAESDEFAQLLRQTDGYKTDPHIFAMKASTPLHISGEAMNGAIYTVAVVRTKTVAQGEGVTTGVQKSEVVHIKQNFPALNDDAAKGIALAEAINKVKDFDVNDPTSPVELRLQKF